MSISPAELEYQLAHINQNLGPTIIGFCAMLLAISSIAVRLRLYAKTLTSSGLGVDDYLIVAALVRSVLQITICTHILTDHYVTVLSVVIFSEITTCADILPYVHTDSDQRPPACAYGFGKHAAALTPELGRKISKVKIFLKGSYQKHRRETLWRVHAIIIHRLSSHLRSLSHW